MTPLVSREPEASASADAIASGSRLTENKPKTPITPKPIRPGLIGST